MKKIENLKSTISEKLIRNLLDKDIVRQTDESTTYSKFEDFINLHLKEYQERQKVNSILNGLTRQLATSKVI
jgi:hypothetical protein